jgi:ribonuclease R
MVRPLPKPRPGKRPGRPLLERPAILRCFAGESRALHVAELAERLGIPVPARRRLRVELDALVSEGRLARLPGQRYRLNQAPGEAGNSWVGTLAVHPRGFAFVNAPDQEDLYLPPTALGAAVHGDVVRVAPVSRSARGLEGRVVEIVERRAARIVGTVRRRGRSVWLEPDDARLRGPIVLSGDTHDAADGVAAVVRITRFPESPDENAEGELLEVLGQNGEARVEVAKVLAREGIVDGHPAPVVREAEARARALAAEPPADYHDLRSVPLLTIDPDDARDHDDAVYVERRPSGYRATIAIADVSEYVRGGGALDADAGARSFTTYLPDRAVPMLPPILASQHCSLLPGVERLSLCVIVDLDGEGVAKRMRLVEARVQVRALLTYRDVACVLGWVEGPPKKPETLDYVAELRLLDELARKLRARRKAKGALDLDLPEPRVVLDAEERPTNVTRRTQEPGVSGAYQLIEEMMLLANERVARWLGTKRSPAVFRVHAPPDPTRLEQLALVAQRLGISFEIESFAEPLELSRWLSGLANHPLKQVLENLALRSLKQAQYDTNNIGHYGLAFENYLHFTSPIRRYPDLLVHRLVKALLRGERPIRDDDALKALQDSALTASRQERVVQQVEREVVDVYRCLLMRDRVGEVFEGRVASVVSAGIYVSIDEPFLDVLVRFEGLGLERYEAGTDGMSVTATRSGERIALGDRMWVEIEEVSLWRRSITARRRLVQRHPHADDEPRSSVVPEHWRVIRNDAPAAARAGSKRRPQRGAGLKLSGGSIRLGSPSAGGSRSARPGKTSKRPGKGPKRAAKPGRAAPPAARSVPPGGRAGKPRGRPGKPGGRR